jgi:hypothetical protein
MVGHRLHGETNTMSWIKNLINRVRLEIEFRRRLRCMEDEEPYIYK